MRQRQRGFVGILDRFLQLEASSGIVLLAAAVVAIAAANSPFAEAFHAVWTRSITLHGTPITPRFLINEMLMVIFFLVAGLEIRRETHGGELSTLRRAALPVIAALGGMIAPALLFLAINPRSPERSGWGIPTATDIAFAVGVLALLGKRVPSSLRVMLLALAIIDDIGAIVVIAVFYSGRVVWSGLAVAALGVVMALALQRARVVRAFAYVPAGIVMWIGLHHAGVHPTIAGVVLGLLTPPAGEPSPLEVLQHRLHPWVAFAIMPLFALANAGVTLHPVHGNAQYVMLGVGVGLVVGKPLGIMAATFLATRLRLVELPRRVTWSGIAVVAVVAGIGFTMSIFIAGLAFTNAPHLDAAKAGVLAASVVAGCFGLAVGRWALPLPHEPDITAAEAEASTVE